MHLSPQFLLPFRVTSERDYNRNSTIRTNMKEVRCNITCSLATNFNRQIQPEFECNVHCMQAAAQMHSWQHAMRMTPPVGFDRIA
jgi:hypothetical protein